MQAWQTRDRITIQKPTYTQGASGSENILWEDIFTNIPAEVLTGDGDQNISSGAEQNSIKARIKIRYFPITVREFLTYRILWENGIYDIKSATLDRTQRREWRLICEDGKIDA